MSSHRQHTCGIYAIVNTANGKYYIGSTGRLKHRQQEHWRELRRNDHGNHHLQAAWNKYGEQAFRYVIMAYVKPASLRDVEQQFLDALHPYKPHGYNIAKTTDSGFRLGLKASPETLERMKQAQRNRSADWLRNNGNSIRKQPTRGKYGRNVYRNGNIYAVRLHVHGQRVYLGSYSTPEEAQAVSAEFRRKTFGQEYAA